MTAVTNMVAPTEINNLCETNRNLFICRRIHCVAGMLGFYIQDHEVSIVLSTRVSVLSYDLGPSAPSLANECRRAIYSICALCNVHTWSRKTKRGEGSQFGRESVWGTQIIRQHRTLVLCKLHSFYAQVCSNDCSSIHTL
jgi:hypothetical protein